MHQTRLNFFCGFTAVLFGHLVIFGFGSSTCAQDARPEPARADIAIVVQDEAVEAVEAVEAPAATEPAGESGQDDNADAPASTTAEAIRSIDGREIRFYMWDGLIVGGEVTIEAIDVETEFGRLRIPIDKILRLYPGLESMPELQAKIDSLVDGLGDREFEVREKSHSELLAMGMLLKNEIDRFNDNGSAERKKHLSDLKKKIEEQEDDPDNPTRPLIRGDLVETPDFSVVGRILQSEFRLKTQFGEITIPLSQIQKGDRTFGLVAPDLKKSVDIEATAFFPEGVPTKIKVNRGDRISIAASGSIHWKNWNTNCGPEGMTDKGQYKSFNSGMLVARIGSDKYVEVGKNSSFVAQSSGELHLGIAMADNFRTGGYNWTGKYTAKIIVKPQGDR